MADLRFLYLDSHLDFHIIPHSLWTTNGRFRVDFLRLLLQSDASLESLLKPLLASAVIHRSTLAKEISTDSSAQNVVRPLIEAKTPDNDHVLQFLASDEPSSLYWIKRGTQAVNIAYPDPSQLKRVEYKILNLLANSYIQFGHIVNADFDELRSSFTHQLFGHGLTYVSGGLCEAVSKDQEQFFEGGDINREPFKHGSLLQRARNEGHDQKIKSIDRLISVTQTEFAVHDWETVESMHSTMERFPDVNGQYQVTRNIEKQCLKSQSPMESGTYGSLGEVFVMAGRFDLAIRCCLRAFSIGETGAIETCARITRTVENMAQSCTESGKFSPALDLYRSLLELKRALFGIDHINTVHTLNNIGIALQQMRKYDEAVSCLNQVLHIYESKPSCETDQAKLANTLQNLGIVYSEQGDQTLAIDCFKRALRFANCDLVLKGVINNLGVAFARKGLLAEAIAFYTSALRASSGCHDLHVADVLYNIGVTEVNVGRMRSGKKHLRKSNRIFNDALGERHFKSMRTQNLLRILQRRKRLSKSTKLRK